MADSSKPDVRPPRAREVFIRVVDCAPENRAALLKEACGDDVALRVEVESLLEHDSQVADDFLRPPAPPPGVHLPATPEGPDPLVGTDVGRYHIKSLIAGGGMGRVYEAVQEQPRRVVALKVMRHNVASHSALRRFEFESQILGHLRHPNVAQVFEAGIHDDGRGGVPYFAMEYVPGAKTIVEYADSEKLSTRDRLRLFAKVCDAVHHGHQKGIIHRDLKPGNILVDSGGEPKVIDFGVARGTDSDLALTTQQTDVGQLVGTIQYMSPEQCDADPNDLDTRADVYSLGVVLYELLTGERPYEATGSTIYEAARVIKEDAPRRLSSINAKLRGDVETIALKAIEKDRERRYQSAADLARDIRHYLNHEPIEARSLGAWRRALRWMARHPAIATTLVCLGIAAAIICGTTATVWFYNTQPNDVVPNTERSEARLLTRSDRRIHTWVGNGPQSICLAEYVDQPPGQGGKKLALVGFRGSAPSDRYEPWLYAFDVAESLEEPDWTGHLRPGDYSGKDGKKPEQFYLSMATLLDIFAKPEGKEIVAVHQHHRQSQCAIRIYDLRGQILYEVWHDGNLINCHWMKDERQLVFAGVNGEVDWEKRGVSGVDSQHPLVVFAIRPEVDQRNHGFLKTVPGDGPLHPVWYQCLLPAQAAGRSDAAFFCDLQPPVASLPGRSVLLCVVSQKHENSSASCTLDNLGNMIDGGFRCNDGYKRNRNNHPDELPDPNNFYLGDLPPLKPAGSE